MLPFVTYPRRYTSNFFVNAELAYLRSKQRGQFINWLGGIVSVICLVFVLKFVSQAWQLIFLLVLVIAVHIVVQARMMINACDLIGGEQRIYMWDSLVLTHLDGQHIILGKWWALLHFMWQDFITLLRLLMALAVSQFPSMQCSQALGALCYNDAAPNYVTNPTFSFPYRSKQYPGYGLPEYYANPEIILKVAFASSALIVFSVLEAGLTAAIRLLIGLLVSQRFSFLIAATIWAALIASAAMLIGFAISYRAMNVRSYYGDMMTEYSYANIPCNDKCIQFQATESFQAITSTRVEDGLSIAVNLLRLKLLMSRTRYFLRNLSWALTGLGVYTLLLWAYLRLTLFIAVKRGATPENSV